MTFRILICFATLLAFTTISFAQERKLSGEEISNLLPKIKTKGPNYTQTFTDKGLTSYRYDGRPSEGRWMVQDDQYCSTWPPNNIIECYDVIADTEKMTITWIGSRNDISKATFSLLPKQN